MLWLAQDGAAGASQQRLSLFDLAEAAASLSPKQASQLKGKPFEARGGAQDQSQVQPQPVTKASRSSRKRKSSGSPEASAPANALASMAQPNGDPQGSNHSAQATSSTAVAPPATRAAGPVSSEQTGLDITADIAAQQPRKKRKHKQANAGTSAGGQLKTAESAVASADGAAAASVAPDAGAASQPQTAVAEQASATEALAVPGSPRPRKKRKRKNPGKADEPSGAAKLQADPQLAVAAEADSARVQPEGADSPAEGTAAPLIADKKQRKHKDKKAKSSGTAENRQPSAAALAASGMNAVHAASLPAGTAPEQSADASAATALPAAEGKKTKKKQRRHQVEGPSLQPSRLPSAAAAAARPAEASSHATHAEAGQSGAADAVPVVAKAKKRKRKDAAEVSPAGTAAPDAKPAGGNSALHTGFSGATEPPATADTAGPAVGEGSQPDSQPKPKRKRKSKAAAPEAVAAATAGSDAAAAEAASGQTPLPKKRGRKPKAGTAQGPSSSAAVAAAGAAAGVSLWREDQQRTDVKKGKFSKQEKETLKQAAVAYAQEHGLPTDSFEWLFNVKASENKKQAAGCWRTIAQSLPHRTYKSVYACGTRMLHAMNYQVCLATPATGPCPGQSRQLIGHNEAAACSRDPIHVQTLHLAWPRSTAPAA